ncbi:NAD-dependent epimerase/dehydratase family protein [Ancrocorticia populi]|uniref:NAD-dependent epimerase/dehydratase family protein n=1 Tax=Ancrocorticia populi TaxID=2175228 RepID=UPI001A9C8C48|nr:NAD-dependent epimerase/dehydratase family protein [Ancrocorticia populi]
MSQVSSIIQDDVNRITELDLPWEQLRDARILVTGASGMIPSYTVLSLLAANDAHGLGIVVYALARNAEKMTRLYGDLLEREDLVFIQQDVVTPIEGLSGITHVIHGASAAQPKNHAKDPAGTIAANVLGTHNLLEFCREVGAKSFTMMSSAEIYGNVPGEVHLIEEDQYGGVDILNPRACYTEGKRASETFSAVYNYQFGIKNTVARFGHIYGPGIALDDGRVQADFARDMFEGQDIIMKSAGLAQRSYTYIGDAVAGMLAAILKGEAGAYNVSDNTGLVSIRELAETFLAARPERHLELRFETESDAFATNKVAFQGLSGTKLEGLGWKPQVTLAAGVDRWLRHLEELNSVAQ